ncbi:MAG TPA: hypothetical protein VIX13_04040, partial [Candidatus Eisenbacteria bacterium]
MRIAASAFISCCSVLVALTVISAAPADPTLISTRPPLNDNPLIQRNNVDSTIAWTAAPPEVQERIKKLLAKVLL